MTTIFEPPFSLATEFGSEFVYRAGEAAFELRLRGTGDEAFLFHLYAANRAAELDAWHWPEAERAKPPAQLQSGLTQVILDLNARRQEKLAGNGVAQYENGAKDQKKASRLPKGSMLDKNAGCGRAFPG